MAKRKPRRPRTIDQVGAINDPVDPFGIPPGFDPSQTDSQGGTITWTNSPDPDLMQAIVPSGTPLDTTVVGISRVFDYPSRGNDTWYAPTTAAIARGKFNAAVETVQATAQDIAHAAQSAINYAPIILLALAALYVFSQMGHSK